MLSLLVLATITGWATADFDPDLHEKYLSMPKSAFVEHFNKQNYTWKITDNHHLLKKYPACELNPTGSIDEIPIITHKLTRNLPPRFDARDKWTQCESIRDVYNQGPCGSCWTFGSATTASDRTCIHKKTHVRLSEQDFECMQTGVCGGGVSHEAFVFWKDYGLVTQDCKPYNPSAGGSRVLTIHEAQGLSSATVVVVNTASKRQKIHDSVPHAVVAISRHTNSCIYYTDSSEDAIYKLIRRAADENEQRIKDYNLKMAIRHRDAAVVGALLGREYSFDG